MKIPVENIISNLETRYDHISKLPDREFFLGVADYIHYLDEVLMLNLPTEALKKALSDLRSIEYVVSLGKRPEIYLVRDRHLTIDFYHDSLFKIHQYIIENLQLIRYRTNEGIHSKLHYLRQDSILEYKSEKIKLRGKCKVLVEFLNNHKLTPYSVEEIKSRCNLDITNRYKFKSYKDIYDTVMHLKKKLKVENNELFPIRKRGFNWIWDEN